MNNIHNKLIEREYLNKLINEHTETKVEVKNIDIYQKAFIHKSCLIKDNSSDPEDNCCVFNTDFSSSNERLEFIGDSILNMITALYIYEIFPKEDEGFLTKLRTKLVRNTQLSNIGTILGFKEWLLISCHVEKILGRDNPRLIEDVFESFIASLYTDLGFEVTKQFIFSCFKKYVDLNKVLSVNDNYKDILLRFYQLNVWSHPVYKLVVNNGNKEFITICIVLKEMCQESPYINTIIEQNIIIGEKYNISYDEYYILGVGIGKTKKEGEQNTSKNILQILKVPNSF